MTHLIKIGIDESNNSVLSRGGLPLVYAGVIYNGDEKKLPVKKRLRNTDEALNFLRHIGHFRYAITQLSPYRSVLDERVHALSQLIYTTTHFAARRFFLGLNGRALKIPVTIDGSPFREDLEHRLSERLFELEEEAGTLPCYEICFRPKADVHQEEVRAADRIAYALFQMIKNSVTRRHPYRTLLVYPRPCEDRMPITSSAHQVHVES